MTGCTARARAETGKDLSKKPPQTTTANQYVQEEIKPCWSKTFKTVIMKNEALTQSQIAQKAVFDFDPDRAVPWIITIWAWN
jgi:hypothetical protein